ncbi:MAG: prolipoprotein diacylglyceryl transferase [Chloroflexi bacterium]|nr:prolipoprotein diacylglyceryl transferase [Chloroflexota bacterium]
MDGISLGPLLIRWNGLLVIFGFALGGILATREVRRMGKDPEIILDLVAPLLIWGTIGARLWHVFTPPLSSIQLGLTTGHYLTHPLDLISIWIGGMGFPGVLLGGSFGLLLFCFKNGFRFSEWADILSPSLVVGYATGRIGNYVNQELYGLPTSVPWRIFIAPENRLAGFENVGYYHPLFAYDILLNLLILLALKFISYSGSGFQRRGDLFGAYLLMYSLARLGLEFVRLDVSIVFNVNINQMVALLVFTGSSVYFMSRNFRRRKL